MPHPQVFADATRHPRFKYFPEAGEDLYHSFLGVPLLDRGLLLGVAVVQTIDARTFSQDEVRMVAHAAAQLAPTVSDARVARRSCRPSACVSSRSPCAPCRTSSTTA